MKYPKARTSEERKALGSALAEIRSDWGFAASFDLRELVQKWQKFVQEVERGYTLSFYDFTHSLEMRDLLEGIRAVVPVRLQEELVSAIKAWDERFMRATAPSAQPIEPFLEEVPREWWYRIPHGAGSEFTAHLTSEDA